MKKGSAMKVIRILASTMFAIITASSVIKSFAQDIQEAASVCTPPPAGLVGWWPGDGTGNDIAGGNNGTWAGFGGVNTYASGIAGQAFVFDGTHRDRVDIGNPANLQLQDFTIEVWIKRSSATVVSLDDNFADGSIAGNGAYIFGYGAGGYGLFLFDAGEVGLTKNSYGGINVPPAITDTNWHHVAVTKSGTNVVFYVDGVLLPAPGPYTDTFQFTSSAAIGSRGDGGGNTFYGNIDELSIYNRGLSSNEIQAIYAASSAGKCKPLVVNCTAPPSGLVAWWPGAGNGNDIIGINNGVLSGNISFVNGEVGQGFSFDGATSTMSVSASSSLDVGKGQGLTLECWVAPAVATNQEPLMEWRGTGAINQGAHFWISVSFAGVGGPGCIYANLVDTAGGTHIFASAPAIIQAGIQQHVALTYDKSNGVGKMYYNGFLVASNNLGIFTPKTDTSLLLGRRADVGNLYYKGIIDELSVYNRPLGSNEVQAIYMAGSAGKCTIPPSSPMITQHPTNQTTMAGSPATFSVVASGSAPISYQWQLNGNPIAGATNSIYAITAVQANQAGAYRVVVTNPFGATNSSTAVLTVLPLPSVPVITDFNPKSGSNTIFVTVIGSNFSPATISNIVYFGAVRAVVSAATKTNLIVSVPVGATYAPITVTVGGLTASAAKPFLPALFAGGAFGANSLGGLVNLTAGNGPARETIGDLDGDGKPDLVVANVYDGTVRIYRNISSSDALSTASFAAPIIFTIGGGTDSLFGLTLADLDGDGRLDIITANRNLNIISVFQNLSSPGNLITNSFGLRTDFKIAGAPSSVAVADLNGDGRPEIVTANQISNSVSILRSVVTSGPITTNSFVLATNLATGSGPFWITIADLNGDGQPDLITANNLASSTVSTLRNLSTSGSIAFAPKVDFAGLGSGGSVTTSDLDGDGKLDVVVGSQSSGQAVSVYRNFSAVGSISLAASVNFATGGWANTVAISDLDGDGKPDMVVAVQLPSHLSVFRNLSANGSLTTASFAPRVDFASGWNPNGIAIGDLNGDGRPDISFGNTYDNNISIYQNQVPFAAPPVITLQPTNQTIILGDDTSFNITATGPQPFTYQWNFNGDAILGATNNPLILTEAQLSQAGNYSVTVANASGSTLSSNATLSVAVPVCTTPPTSLTAWWQAESNTLDSVGTNYGLNVGNVAFTPSKAGRGFNFNGSNYISIADAPALNPTNAITVEAWIFRKAVVGTWDPVIKKSDNSQLNGYALEFNGNNLLFWIYNNGWRSSGGSVPIALGKWYHVAGVYNGTHLMCFTNGVLAASFLTSGSITPAVNPLAIGNDPGNSTSRFFNGIIDEVSLYNRALSTNEIAAIYAARGAGKCPLQPTVLNVTPSSWYVNEGATVACTVTAVGSPVLTYQWQHGGLDIVGATNATLTLNNVTYAQAGNYAVVVSNPAGLTTSSNVLLRVNRAPIADASATDTLAISPNGTNAIVVLDGSHSSDPDGDALAYAWFNFGDTNVLATGVVAITPLPVGTNQITLTVNDGMALNSQTIAIEVITTSQAVDRLIALVKSGSGNTQPLVASLRAALAAIDRSQPAVAINQLEAFINKVQVQLAPSDPVLAAQLIADAQAIIDALNGGTSVAVAAVEITSLTPDQHGKSHLKIKGIKGRVHVVETSTNMVDWVPVGVANQSADGSYEFDASDAQNAGARFYRVVSPK